MESVEEFFKYRRQALRQATISPLGRAEGYATCIPGFPDLIATGRTKKETLRYLASALEGWLELARERGLIEPKGRRPPSASRRDART
jgi:predicted RNase H-like HicB family nuclease